MSLFHYDSTQPLVSCIMPTKDRGKFIRQAIKYFLNQDYPNKELVIVDSGLDKIQDLIPINNKIKYVKLEKNISIGESRNIAIANCDGEIIIHWDDDDWYGLHRISNQIKPILQNECDLTGVDGKFIYDISEQQFWIIDSNLHAAIMSHDILGGSIAYRKKLWDDGTKFYTVDCSEDALFIQNVSSKGAVILKLQNNADYVYIRHNNNTWKFDCGQYGNPALWNKIKSLEFIDEDDLNFYKQIASNNN